MKNKGFSYDRALPWQACFLPRTCGNRGNLALQRLIFALVLPVGLGKKPRQKTRQLMPRTTFIAETNLQGHVIAVWVQENTKRPRIVSPTDATLALLEHAQFSGAPKEAIVAWVTAALKAQKTAP